MYYPVKLRDALRYKPSHDSEGLANNIVNYITVIAQGGALAPQPSIIQREPGWRLEVDARARWMKCQDVIVSGVIGGIRYCWQDGDGKSATMGRSGTDPVSPGTRSLLYAPDARLSRHIEYLRGMMLSGCEGSNPEGWIGQKTKCLLPD